MSEFYDDAETAWRGALNEQGRLDLANRAADDYVLGYHWVDRCPNLSLPNRPTTTIAPHDLGPPSGLRNLHGFCYMICAYTTLLNLPYFVALVMDHICSRSCITCSMREFMTEYHSPIQNILGIERTSRALTEHCEALFWGLRAKSLPKKLLGPLDNGGSPDLFLERLLYHVRGSLIDDAMALQEFDRLFSTELRVVQQCPGCRTSFPESYRKYLIWSKNVYPPKSSSLAEHIRQAVNEGIAYGTKAWCRLCNKSRMASYTTVNFPVYLIYTRYTTKDFEFDGFAADLNLKTDDTHAEYCLQSVIWDTPGDTEHASGHVVSLAKGSKTGYLYLTDNDRTQYLGDSWADAYTFTVDQQRAGYPSTFGQPTLLVMPKALLPVLFWTA